MRETERVEWMVEKVMCMPLNYYHRISIAIAIQIYDAASIIFRPLRKYKNQHFISAESCENVSFNLCKCIHKIGLNVSLTECWLKSAFSLWPLNFIHFFFIRFIGCSQREQYRINSFIVPKLEKSFFF